MFTVKFTLSKSKPERKLMRPKCLRKSLLDELKQKGSRRAAFFDGLEYLITSGALLPWKTRRSPCMP